MPEEFNRIIADQVADYRFCSSKKSIENLEKEGLLEGNYLVGDIMKDLIAMVQKKTIVQKSPLEEAYYYASLHRPYNVDDQERLTSLLQMLNRLDNKVVFSLHLRTKKNMKSFDMKKEHFSNIQFISPVSYFENIRFMNCADAVFTDSGGMQKEAYWLKKKCITLRSETEWIETMEHGWNTLVYDDLERIEYVLQEKPGLYDEGLYGDGRAAERIWEILVASYQKQDFPD